MERRFFTPFFFSKLFKWSASLLAMAALIVLLLPFAIQFGIEKALQQQGAGQVSIANVDFNPFRGRLQIDGLEIYSPSADTTTTASPVLRIQQAQADLGWLNLVKKRLLLQNVTLTNASVDIQQNDPRSLVIAGLFFPLGQSAETEESDGTTWTAGIQALNFSNLTLRLLRPGQAIDETTYRIEKLTLNDLYMWDAGSGRLILNSHLNQALVNSHFRLQLFSVAPKIIGTVRFQDLELDELPYLNDASQNPELKLKGQLSADVTFTAELNEAGLTIDQQGEFTLKQTQLSLPPYQIDGDSIRWSGSLRFEQLKSQADSASVKLEGQLDLKQFALQDTQQSLSLHHSLQAALKLEAALSPQTTEVQQQGTITLIAPHFELASLSSQANKVTWQGALHYLSDETSAHTLQAKGRLSAEQAQLNDQANGLQLTQNITNNVDLNLTLDAGSLKLTQNGLLKVQNLNLLQPPFQVALNELEWNGSLSLDQQTTLAVELQGAIGMQGLTTSNHEKQMELASLNTLKIKQLNVKQAADCLQANLNQLSLNQIRLASQTKAPFIELGHVSLDQAALRNLNEFKIGNLKLAQGETSLTVNQEGKIVQLENLLANLQTSEPAANEPSAPETNSTEQPADTTTPSQEQAAAALTFSVNSITLTQPHQIRINSERFTQPIQKNLELKTLKFGSLNSRKPDADTPYEIHLVADEFSKIHSEGTVQPLNPELTAHLSTQIEGLNLVDFSPLSAQFIGYEIDSGQLSANLKTDLDRNQIDAENDLLLNKLKLKAANKDKSQQFEQGLSMPIDAALSLLRDKQDNIKLKLPIKGDISNPDFRLDDVINKALAGAMQKATKTYLLLALQPFGAIALAGDFLTQQAGAIQLQSVEFAAGKTVLNSKMTQYLGKVATMLQERKGVQIKVCGAANQVDRLALLGVQSQSASQDKNKTSQKDGQAQLPTVADEQLLQLADARAVAIKRYLLDQGVKTGQVILCQPRLSQEARSAPKVALGI
ncbi:DUF748 domain-containing protein [Thiomicrorhabdus sp. zzn3]|uniref:DUF748 domain-containing protein n=1 Tax=Thiomicrorhabdus sp. zzn3 TaxID=3039775 RepID=UPI002436B674|nr:DUF748 domain-containing protein [Thiomicrorhabdus sp. zzn3]MDG6778890.1 DUF748 domain-containing protein [Thiomicrorhabdus sp. zzn3]